MKGRNKKKWIVDNEWLATFVYIIKTKILLPQAYMTLADFSYPVQALWFSCSQILALLFRPYGFLAPRFWLSCSGPMVFLLPDFSYPVQALWFSYSQIVALLFRPYGFLAPRFWLSCLGPMVFLLEWKKILKKFFIGNFTILTQLCDLTFFFKERFSYVTTVHDTWPTADNF